MPSRELGRNLVLLVRTVMQHLREDPVHLLVQGSRRLPARPARLLSAAVASVPRTTTRALSAHLVGDREAVRRAVEAGLRHRRGRVLRTELALATGIRVPAEISVPASVRARDLWRRGRMEEALEVLAGRRHRALSRRLRGELATLHPRFEVQPPADLVPPGYTGRTGTVLHVLTNSLPHTQSGYTLRTHRLLAALVGRGLTVHAATRLGWPVLVGIPWGADEQEIDGVAYHRMLAARLGPDLPSRLRQQTRMMAHLVARERPAVLHCTTNYVNALMTRALAEAFGLPWVYEVRGLLEETWASGQGDEAAREAARSSPRFSALREQETRMMRAADRVVTLSGTMRARLIERGIPAEKVVVVPNAVDPAVFAFPPSPGQQAPGAEPSGALSSGAASAPRTADRPAAREALGLPREGFWVGSVSSLVDYEGFDILLRAVAGLRARGEDVRVLLVGDGAARPALERLAGELGLLGPHGPSDPAGPAVFPGRRPRAEAPNWHRALDVFCVPRRDASVCRQVTPLKPVEAMAAGTPVLVSDLPPLTELTREAYAGLRGPAEETIAADVARVPPGDPERWGRRLLELRDQPRLREMMGQAGADFAANRTWARDAQILESLYEELMVRKGAAWEDAT